MGFPRKSVSNKVFCASLGGAAVSETAGGKVEVPKAVSGFGGAIEELGPTGAGSNSALGYVGDDSAGMASRSCCADCFLEGGAPLDTAQWCLLAAPNAPLLLP